MDVVRPSACRSERVLVIATGTVLEAAYHTAIQSLGWSYKSRRAIRARYVCEASLHHHAGVALDRAMIALMRSSAVLILARLRSVSAASR